jgi:hypothetical protein
VTETKDIGKALLATEVGTARDKETLDATTGRINQLLYKVSCLWPCQHAHQLRLQFFSVVEG